MALAAEAAVDYKGPQKLETAPNAIGVKLERIKRRAERKAQKKAVPAEPSFYDKQEHDAWEKEFGW